MYCRREFKWLNHQESDQLPHCYEEVMRYLALPGKVSIASIERDTKV